MKDNYKLTDNKNGTFTLSNVYYDSEGNGEREDLFTGTYGECIGYYNVSIEENK